jgi:hypothetical protein
MLVFLQQPLLFFASRLGKVRSGRLATGATCRQLTMVIALGALGTDGKLSHHRA